MQASNIYVCAGWLPNGVTPILTQTGGVTNKPFPIKALNRDTGA